MHEKPQLYKLLETAFIGFFGTLLGSIYSSISGNVVVFLSLITAIGGLLGHYFFLKYVSSIKSIKPIPVEISKSFNNISLSTIYELLLNNILLVSLVIYYIESNHLESFISLISNADSVLASPDDIPPIFSENNVLLVIKLIYSLLVFTAIKKTLVSYTTLTKELKKGESYD